MEFYSESTSMTEEIACEMAKKLSGGEIITLDGDLGAGKTAFVRGLARGIGASDIVSSPTFTIVNEYRTGRIPLLHFDVYRLGSSDEMYDIGWEDYVSQNAVIVMEWSVIVSDILPNDCIRINISKDYSKSDDYRIITVEGASI